jgi:hypothetical protein
MVNEPQSHEPATMSDERWNALEELDEWLRTPMLVLSFLWLLLVVVELVWGTFDALETFGTVIWIAFLIEFAIRVALAPEKTPFLSQNWLRSSPSSPSSSRPSGSFARFPYCALLAPPAAFGWCALWERQTGA